MNEQNDVSRALHTRVVLADEARAGLLEGMRIAAEAVGCTLGPRGMTVLIARGDEPAINTKDGVTVSRAIRLKDPLQRMGADLIREAAAHTNDAAGDGTTTATILTHAMARAAARLIAAGNSPVALRRGIERAALRIVANIRAIARDVRDREAVAQVGTVSANGDRRIGDIIADAMERVGRDGIVTVEDAKGTLTSLDVVEGMRFERGYLSPYFVTNQERMHARHDDAYVLVTDKKLTDMQELVPILEAVLRSQRPLLIIADEIEGQALQALIVNRLRGEGALQVVAVRAPGYGASRDAQLHDIAALTGAKVASTASSLPLQKMTLQDLGRCKRVVVDARTTTIVGSGATTDAVTARANEIRSQLEDPTIGQAESHRLRERLARLASGVAVVRVGGATELEMIERKHRIEDALHATRAAVEEGIVPGGGTALALCARAALVERADIPDEGERAGFELVVRACEAPMRRIAENAGASPDVVAERVGVGGPTCGFNAATGEYGVDLVAAGVVDPTKVTRLALEHAASVAAAFVSISAAIIEE